MNSRIIPDTVSQAGGARRRQGATLVEVAQAAQVSTATVSRALNHPGLVSADTLARIHDAIAATGYIPALSTGPLISNRSRLIGIMIPPTPLELFDATVRSAVAGLGVEGYQALLGIYNRAATREELVTQIFSRRPSGLILIGMPALPGIRELMIESALPIVETWEMPRTPVDMVAGISHDDIGIAIGNFLLARNYRRPVIFSTISNRGLLRRYGISRVLMEAGLDEPRTVEHALPGSVGEGRRSLRAIIEAGEDLPDVIVCASDWLAQGVLIEAAVQGINVPRDMGVIGFGDFNFAAELEPALTTVRIDGGEMGRWAAELMLAALRKGRRRRRSDDVVDIGFQLVERGST